MPFTPSHPAAALPIWPLVRRGVVPLAPFAIGAMVPDFEYLFRLEPLSLISHSARGLVVFCLPVALLSWLLWEALLQPTGRELVALPPLAPAPMTAATVARAVVALALGSASHISWDAFTHRYTRVADRWPVLGQAALVVGGREVLWHSVFQHASTLVGAVVVITWLSRALAANGRTLGAIVSHSRRRAWAALGTVALLVGLWNAPRRGQMIHVRRAPIVAGRFVVGAMDGLALAFAALAVRRRGTPSLRT